MTPRQSAAAALLARGMTNAQIARALGIRLGTAKNHVAAVMAELGCARRAEAAHVLTRRMTT